MKRYSLPLLAAMFVAGCSCAHRADRFQLDPGDDGGSTDGGMGDSSVPFDGSSDAGHDAGTECAEGESRPCPGGIDIGECNPGLQNCVDGQWGDCEGMISPADEICDELDNDCDGVVDGLAASLSCGAGAVCEAGTCMVASCPAATGDCDGDLTNGCETDLASSETHCGVCSNACVWSCDAGACDDPTALSVDQGRCAIRRSGTVACVGTNNHGQLGNGTTTDSATPVLVSGVGGVGNLGNVTQVAAGQGYTCARRSDSTVACWGDNGRRQLGGPITLGNRSTTPVVVQLSSGSILGSVERVAAGRDTACALLRDSTVMCWGREAGFRSGTENVAPAVVRIGTSALSNVSEIGIGYAHGCALQADGVVRCWGSNQYGQRGRGEALSGAADYTREPVPGLAGVSDLAVGSEHTCALLDTGAVRCWGNNSSGQLGDGSMVVRSTPVAVNGISDATAISVTTATTCALHSDQTVSCWGASFGATPAPLAGMTGIEELAFPCGRRADGTVLCWDGSAAIPLPAPE